MPPYIIYALLDSASLTKPPTGDHMFDCFFIYVVQCIWHYHASTSICVQIGYIYLAITWLSSASLTHQGHGRFRFSFTLTLCTRTPDLFGFGVYFRLLILQAHAHSEVAVYWYMCVLCTRMYSVSSVQSVHVYSVCVLCIVS